MSSHLEGNLDVNSEIGVILPTYCEAQNIGKLIKEIENLQLDISILVIDDSSPDRTAEIVRDLQRKYANILLLVRLGKHGLGTAITEGFRTFLSLKNPPRYVITMDADYSHNPRDIPRLLSIMQCGCGLVIGSRYCRGGEIAGWPSTRRIISRLANAIAKFVVDKEVHDCTSGFRCYSTEFVREGIGNLHSQTYEIQIETIKQACCKGFEIKEVPILFVNRKKGKSKLTIAEVKSYVFYIFKTITRL
jgi:dolichol-phosphate mannosyltransferase